MSSDSGETTIEDQVVDAVRRLVRAADLHSRRLSAGFGLTGPQLAVLRELSRSTPSSAAALARSLHLGQATLTGILQRLEQRGFVQRSRRTDDRRTVTITVTALGQEALQRGPSLLQERFRVELRRMEPWERSMLLANLQRLAAMMDVDRETPGASTSSADHGDGHSRHAAIPHPRPTSP